MGFTNLAGTGATKEISQVESEGAFRCGTYLEHVGVCVEDGGQPPTADVRLCLDVQVLVPHFDLGQINPHPAPYRARNRGIHHMPSLFAQANEVLNLKTETV